MVKRRKSTQIMKKTSIKIVILVAIFILLSADISINYNAYKEHKKDPLAYESFVSAVKRLEKELSHIKDTKSNETGVQMFDAFDSIIFVNMRLDYLKSDDFNDLKHYFTHLQFSYNLKVRNQISELESFDSQTNQYIKNQIHLFLSELPPKYKNTKEFYEQLNKATDYIKGFTDIL